MALHRLIMVAAAALACTAVVAGAGAAGGVTFSPKVDNPWFPLKPGTRYVYVGEKDAQRGRDVVTVTHGTRTIAGARCMP